MELRPLVDGDLGDVLALNQSEVPNVGPLTSDGLVALVARCDLALVASDEDGIAGMLLALAPGTDYGSPNYRFFEQRGTDHLYVDRVAVAARARRRGLASALYDQVERHARASGRAEVTCEVNVQPPNDASLRFHAARGFVEVGQQQVGDHRVSLLAKPLR
ncbi:GNAT family N-acetyltransferase [Egicoccus sp. AB-alg6-2]|uniref:GNAT family N-acetyltransferase n=1 Tax=Egicoccus sp. AB-alg6-2 TaxID=3242692 RepID=UPI00359ECA1A